MNVTYVVHDLVDAAVMRRVSMLKKGGVNVTLLGFHRGAESPSDIAGLAPVHLGRTYPAALGKRAASVAWALTRIWSYADSFAGSRLVIARNLECMVVAALAKSLFCRQASFVYECLDIHRIMLNTGFKGKFLRRLERYLLKSADKVVISSEAFAENYFRPFHIYSGPFILVENKVFSDVEIEPVQKSAQKIPTAGEAPVWRIGWFGVIRCQRSLDLLSEFAASMAGSVVVIIRGRVALHEFRDFASQVDSSPYILFEGPYKNPDDLARIYSDVHFAWAIDYFEAGQNSSWLLPNRIYECGLHGVVAIADRNVETGRWLAERKIGVLLDNVEPADLASLFKTLTLKDWQQLRSKIQDLPLDTFVSTAEDCKKLVDQLVSPKVNT